MFSTWSKTFKEVALTGEVELTRVISTRLQAIGFFFLFLSFPCWLFLGKTGMALSHYLVYPVVIGFLVGLIEVPIEFAFKIYQKRRKVEPAQ